MSEIGSGTGSDYPGSLDTDSNLEVDSPAASKTLARADVVNDLAAAIIAMQTELGIDPAGSLTSVKDFLQTEHGVGGRHNGVFAQAIEMDQLSSPSNPAAANNKIYPKSDDQWYTKNSSGVESQVGFLGRGYIDGCIMSNGTDTAHDIDIAAGVCRDSTNAADITVPAITKQIDSPFAEGTNAGGLMSGSPGADTWYYVYAIVKDSDNSVDVYIDSSNAASGIPSGYTKYRRIGAVLTDSSANILQFVQTGDKFEWLVPIEDYDASNTQGSTAISHTLSVPALSKGITAIMNLRMDDFSNISKVLVSSLNMTDAAPSDTASPGSTLKSDQDGTNGNETFLGGYECEAVSGAVRARASTTLDQFSIWTTGWIDSRGKDT